MAEKFYHGSSNQLEVGTRLVPSEKYAENWTNTDFYSILEMYRPENKLAHKDAVFMVGDPDDIDLAGGSTEWCFEVIPEGTVTRHDLNWSSEISMLVSEGYPKDAVEIINAARNYWDGIPHPNESVWEYLTTSAVIVEIDTYENFPSPGF